MIRRHYRDEEPDVDEVRVGYSEWLDTVAGTCERCGHSDHRSAECGNCPPMAGLKRRSKAEQLAATRRAKPLDHTA